MKNGAKAKRTVSCQQKKMQSEPYKKLARKDDDDGDNEHTGIDDWNKSVKNFRRNTIWKTKLRSM